MKFTPGFLKQVILEDGPEGVEWLDEIETGHGRWHRHITTIFRFEGKAYGVDWNRGLTEGQEHEYPGEYSKELIDCPEYELKEKVIKTWEPVE